MSLRSVRSLCVSALRRGIWTDYTSRPAGLKLIDSQIKNGLFNEIPAEGPASVQVPAIKQAYHSPNDIDATFQAAHEYLEQRAADLYKQAEATTDPEQKDALLIEAEKYNPEVLYNQLYHSDKLDRSIPVYREYLHKKWRDYDLMITMQRLETLHVIPDTLPTLDPRADIKVRFPHNTTHSEFNNWVTPGSVVPAFGAAEPPTIQIQDFDNITNETRLYTVVVVNPDVPDVESNSYKTDIHYGLANVPLTGSDNTISASKLLEHGDLWTFQPYQPLVPEKNTPAQRACVWVFRQERPISVEKPTSPFDIQAFTESHSLTPVGAHVWRQTFDRSVNDVRATYGLEKGRVFHKVRNAKPLV